MARRPPTLPLRRPLALVALALALALLAASPAAARGGGGDDARATGSCGGSASAELRLKSDDGQIEVELRVRSGHSGQRWSVVLVHERRVAWRGSARTRGSSGSFRIRRSLPDFGGADEVSARASGPRGITCQATAVLASS